MKKAQAETIVRSLVHDWAATKTHRNEKDWHPSWYEFRSWLLERHANALSFRSTVGADHDAELWFDEELGQTWRR